MPKNKSIVHQVKETLDQKLRIGKKKHMAKQDGTASDGIYSWGTYNTYLAKGCNFAKWAKDNFGCKTLEEARKHINDYLQHRIDREYTPSTQKTIASALAKLYGCSTKDFIPTQDRRRADITRSRLGKANEGFSESNNKAFVEFCRATGLRRSEVKHLRPENLSFDESTGRYGLVDVKGKGGRLRDCPIISVGERPANTNINATAGIGISVSSVKSINLDTSASMSTSINVDTNEVINRVVERMQNTPFGQLVWDKVPTRADIHSYRADYCKTIYNFHARPIDEIPKKERYYCRGDRKGIVYDKRAMAVASRALGHNRISIIAGHYLYERATPHNAHDESAGSETRTRKQVSK